MSNPQSEVLRAVTQTETMFVSALNAPKKPTSLLTHGTLTEAEELKLGSLTAEAARETQVKRVLDGFVGFVAFAAVVGDQVICEGYDTTTRIGLSTSRPLKRSFTGKWKPTDQATIGDDGLLAAQLKAETPKQEDASEQEAK